MNNQPNLMNSGIKEVAPLEASGIKLLNLLQVVAENLRLLVATPLVLGVIALGVSFLIPPTYTATATFLPPQQQQGIASSLLQSLGAVGGLASATGAIKNPNDQYVSFLKSNTVEDALIIRFNLIDRYDVKFKTDARKVLEQNTHVVSGKDNIVSVSFDDKVPEFAAQVANAYGEELTKLLGTLAITEAQQRRLFFGKQLTNAKDGLVAAEQALSATGVSVAALNANPSTALAGPASLRAQVTAQQVKLASMRAYLTESAPEFRRTLAELEALRSELAKAESAKPASSLGGNDYIAKYRDFKYQETLFDLFSRQYEIARVDESREGASLQLIDRAQAPERKAKPKKALIALGVTLLSFFMILIFIFARNALRSFIIVNASEAAFQQLCYSLRRSLGRG